MNNIDIALNSIGTEEMDIPGTNIPLLHQNTAYETTMQSVNTRPFESDSTQIRYTSDPSILRLTIFNSRLNEFEEDETIVGVAIHVDSNSEEFSEFNGLYLRKGPTSHSDLRSSVRLDGGVMLPMYHDNFADREYIHGFYTNKGNFITRRQARWLVEQNNLNTAVPVHEISARHGCMSSDLWKEGQRSHLTASSDKFNIPLTNETPKVVVPRERVNGKVKPMSASEMMKAKKLKKKNRMY